MYCQELKLTKLYIFFNYFLLKALFLIQNHSIVRKNIHRWRCLVTWSLSDQSEASIQITWSLWTNQRGQYPDHVITLWPIRGQYPGHVITLDQSVFWVLSLREVFANANLFSKSGAKTEIGQKLVKCAHHCSEMRWWKLWKFFCKTTGENSAFWSENFFRKCREGIFRYFSFLNIFVAWLRELFCALFLYFFSRLLPAVSDLFARIILAEKAYMSSEYVNCKHHSLVVAQYAQYLKWHRSPTLR